MNAKVNYGLAQRVQPIPSQFQFGNTGNNFGGGMQVVPASVPFDMSSADYSFGSGNSGLGMSQDASGLGLKFDGLSQNSVGSNGFNWGNFSNGLSTALGGIQTLGNLWGGIQAGRLAKEQFNFQRDITNTNLNNSIKDYNTSLEGRMQARAAMETGDANAYADRIAERQLTR